MPPASFDLSDERRYNQVFQGLFPHPSGKRHNRAVDRAILAGDRSFGFLLEKERLEMDGDIPSCRVSGLDRLPGHLFSDPIAGKEGYPDAVLES